jgi:hypothetical protein
MYKLERRRTGGSTYEQPKQQALPGNRGPCLAVLDDWQLHLKLLSNTTPINTARLYEEEE